MKSRAFLVCLCLSVVPVGFAAPTLIYNGDFKLGDVNVGSEYVSRTYDTSPTRLDGGGLYMVRRTWQEGHPNWPTYGDHTSGSGRMFMANGAQDQRVAWSQTDIPVLPERDYTVTYYTSSSSTTAPPRIQTTINGQVMGTAQVPLIGPDPTVGTWTGVSYTWNSGTSTTATIRLRDVETAWVGNDFALDDINLRTRQLVYLEFGQAQAEVPVSGRPTYLKPSAGLSQSDVTTVLNNVNNIYSEYLVDFTTTQPNVGDYSIVNVGGTRSDLPQNLQGWFGARTLGKAEQIDMGNADQGDVALVFSGNAYFNNNLGRLSQVIAHEAAHILGLFHVEPDDQLMHPFAESFRRALDDSVVNLARINSQTNLVEPLPVSGPPYYRENAYEELARNLGTRTTSMFVDDGPRLADAVRNGLDLTASSLLSAIFDAQLAVVMCEDVFPMPFDLGDLSTGSSLHLEIPLLDSFDVFLYGSSFDGGPIDIFSAPTLESLSGFTIDNLDYTVLGQSGLLSSARNFGLFQWQQGAGFATVGQVTLGHGAVTIPAPGAIVLGAIGAGLVSYLRRRRVL